MNSWAWVVLGVVVLLVLIVVIVQHASKGTGPVGAPEKVSESVEVNLPAEVNVEVPEINEEIVEMNLPEEI